MAAPFDLDQMAVEIAAMLGGFGDALAAVGEVLFAEFLDLVDRIPAPAVE